MWGRAHHPSDSRGSGLSPTTGSAQRMRMLRIECTRRKWLPEAPKRCRQPCFVVPYAPFVHVTLPSNPVPVFPLPGVFLYPHQVLPLHVFEPRYRQLIGDLLDGPGRFVIGTVTQGQPQAKNRQQNQPPELLPVAGLGEILRHEKLPDGRYQIWVLGLSRVRIDEVPSDRLYRQVRCEPFVEIDASEDESTELAQQLHAATVARIHQPLPLVDTTPPSVLADLLVQTLGASTTLLERFYTEPSVAARARLVLNEAHGASDQPLE